MVQYSVSEMYIIMMKVKCDLWITAKGSSRKVDACATTTQCDRTDKLT